MAVYFASDNTADGSRDGSIDHPWLDPSELPSASRMSSGTEYLFRCDTETNLSAAFRSTAETAAAITIGSWGSGARPIITAYRMLDGSECVECDVDNSGATAVLTIPPVGGAGSTNLWRVPKTFFGLFAGEIWGAATDVVDAAGYGKVLPAAAREWCGAVADADAITGGYGVVYSEGNPVDVYGGLYASSFDEGDWATVAEQCAFATRLARGGFEMSGLDLRLMYRLSQADCGTTASVYDLALHSFNDLRIANVYRGINLNTGAAYAPGIQHGSVRVYDNYAENMGIGLIDTAGVLYTPFNDTRIYRNVLNGFSRAMSWGGFYLAGGVHTTDGSRIIVEDNTACNGDANHFWEIDGYAFYQERQARNIEFRRNLTWNCKRNYIALWGREDVVFSANTGIAPATQEPSESHFITINSNHVGVDYEDHQVRVHGNVAVGFLHFATCNDNANSVHKIFKNVSLGSGSMAGAGGSLTEAVYTNVYGAASTLIDGNNFYNHGHQLRDESAGNQDDAPYVTNKITSDPSAEIARLPVPTDPTVNYALQIRTGNRIKAGGVVDLRPGTRVVA